MHEASFQGLDTVDAPKSLCLFVGADERPLRGAAGFLDWRLCGGLSRLLQQGFFQGQWGEKLLLTTSGKVPAALAFVFGVGKRAELTEKRTEEALALAKEALLKAKVSQVALAPLKASSMSDAQLFRLVKDTFQGCFSKEQMILLMDHALS